MRHPGSDEVCEGFQILHAKYTWQYIFVYLVHLVHWYIAWPEYHLLVLKSGVVIHYMHTIYVGQYHETL